MGWQRKEPWRCMSRVCVCVRRELHNESKDTLVSISCVFFKINHIKNIHNNECRNETSFSSGKNSGILEHVSSCVGKAEGLKSTSMVARWFGSFGLMSVKLLLAREPQHSWLFQSYLCGHESACYSPWWRSTTQYHSNVAIEQRWWNTAENMCQTSMLKGRGNYLNILLKGCCLHGLKAVIA